VVGVGLVTLSFRFLDRAVPAVHLERTGFGQIPRLVYRPGVMFLMGLLVTVVTMSVSISVGILVPLSARGYVRRENIIPYILGANISTLVDTLAACVFLGAPQTLSVVVVHMAATTLVSLPVVLIAYRPYERAISNVLAWVTSGRAHLALFLGVVFVVPLVLVLL
jgi:sodium-dependent phosphate cotransporter